MPLPSALRVRRVTERSKQADLRVQFWEGAFGSWLGNSLDGGTGDGDTNWAPLGR